MDSFLFLSDTRSFDQVISRGESRSASRGHWGGGRCCGRSQSLDVMGRCGGADAPGVGSVLVLLVGEVIDRLLERLLRIGGRDDERVTSGGAPGEVLARSLAAEAGKDGHLAAGVVVEGLEVQHEVALERLGVVADATEEDCDVAVLEAVGPHLVEVGVLVRLLGVAAAHGGVIRVQQDLQVAARHLASDPVKHRLDGGFTDVPHRIVVLEGVPHETGEEVLSRRGKSLALGRWFGHDQKPHRILSSHSVSSRRAPIGCQPLRARTVYYFINRVNQTARPEVGRAVCGAAIFRRVQESINVPRQFISG